MLRSQQVNPSPMYNSQSPDHQSMMNTSKEGDDELKKNVVISKLYNEGDTSHNHDYYPNILNESA